MGERRGASPPTIILEQKLPFHLKLENIKFLDVKNIWDLSLFIEQDIRDKK